MSHRLPPASSQSVSLAESLFALYGPKKGRSLRTRHLHDDRGPLFINRLIKESSPYLRQHAFNPVDWHTFGDEAFEEAKAYEKTALDNGAKFTWCRSETLDELAHPERVAKIKADHQKALERAERRKEENPLRPNASRVDLDDIYGGGKGCVICHK